MKQIRNINSLKGELKYIKFPKITCDLNRPGQYTLKN